MAQSLRTVLPDIGGKALARQATALPYASLSVDINGNRGLLIMGTQAGDTTYWQSSDSVTLALRHGGLTSTGGLKNDLVGTHYYPRVEKGSSPSTSTADYSPWLDDAPTHYRLERSWINDQGVTMHDSAEGRMHCAPAAPVALPLQTRRLERCTLVHEWRTGETTTDIIWRDPVNRQPWAGRMVPWPEQRALAWRVAKPWWQPAPRQATGDAS